MTENKTHFISTIGFVKSKYLGILFEVSRNKMSDPEGVFYGVSIYIYDMVIVIGVCVHDKRE